MDILQDGGEQSTKSFLNHVFSSTEDGKAELLNVVQYSTMGVIPIVMLNKFIQRFVPEADSDKSSLEVLVEIFLQLIIMFCGIVVIHRIITYFPTYSGFKYESLTLTNVILAFLVIILSIQTKLGLKVNILVDRIVELWNGPNYETTDDLKKKLRQKQMSQQHSVSQADYLDNSAMQSSLFPPAPVPTTRQSNNPIADMFGSSAPRQDSMPMMAPGPMAANGLLGGSFGAAF
jgi:hypothetical protein